MENLDELVLNCSLYIADVTQVLIEYIASAIEFITTAQYDFAQEVLQRCDEILLSASKQSVFIEVELLTLISHTYAYYFYSINDTHNASIYLFKAIQIFKQKPVASKSLQKIMNSRVLCSMHLQLYGIYAGVDNHEMALIHVKEALKKSEEIIQNCIVICQEHMFRHKSLYNYLKHPQYNLHESPHYKLFHQLVLKSLPVLMYTTGKTSEAPKIQTEWVPQVTLEDIYKVQPLEYASLIKGPELLEEFQEECLLYKINIHASICYLIIEECKKLKSYYDTWMEMAWKCIKVLPHDWLISQIIIRTGENGWKRKSKSVRQHESVLAGRKASFSPSRQGAAWQSSTPSNFNSSGKNSFDFSKRLKKRSRIV